MKKPLPKALSLFDLDCLYYTYGRLLKGRLKHYCPDWDYLPIDETCPEYSGCTCYQSEKEEGASL